ncbi:MAG: FHA domain-containing protein [Anaerolineales bacterium]|nr:FHA domain-containing protein [Anaerolineales bacterium]
MAPQQFQFIMRTGPTPGKIFELITNELYIGREVTNDITIDDAEVSRKHARLIMQAGGYLLEDLGSTNGTYVNGQRLMGPHVLRPGELVKLGENVSLAFEAGYDPDATMVASPSQFEPATFQPPPKESYVPAAQPQPVPQPPPQPAYSEPVPATTAQPYTSPEEGKSNRTWLYAGCGCLVVVLCVAVAGAYLFDYLNMYCTPPFNVLFTCP